MISQAVTTKISKSTFSHPCSKFLARLGTLGFISWWRVTFVWSRVSNQSAKVKQPCFEIHEDFLLTHATSLRS